jgi:predicted phosphodiesterase
MRKARHLKDRCFVLWASFVIAVFFCPRPGIGDIVIFGDSQLNEDAQVRVVEAVRRCRPSAVFRVGDLVDDGNDPRQWKAFRRINTALLKETKYYPALGNHEKDSPLYFKEFPELHNRRWYAVDHEGIHFIVLDSNSDLKPGSAQYRWFLSDLKRLPDRIKFRIVIFHHPLFSAGERAQDEQNLREVLLSLFQRYRVCVVFTGHDHCYERLMVDDISFIITGGGGSRLIQRTQPSPHLIKLIKEHHFCLLSREGDLLRVNVINVDGLVIDEFDIYPR